MRDKRIAIIGTGISGLVCGYYLFKKGYDLALYEASDYIGGHTNTADVEFNGEKHRVASSSSMTAPIRISSDCSMRSVLPINLRK